MTIMKSLMFIGILANSVFAQQISVLAPREIDKASAKVEQAWAAWQEVRPEAHLLSKSTKQALAEIDRSSINADAYLDAKVQFYVSLSEAFHQQTEAIRQENAGHISAATLTPGEKQRLNVLLDRENATRQRIADLEKQSNRTPRQQLEIESLARQEKDLGRLQEEVRKRIDTLDQLGKNEDKAGASRAALIDTLDQIVRIMDERVEATSLEKTRWRNYHQELRELVVDKGGNQ
jgi:hypothetical protein